MLIMIYDLISFAVCLCVLKLPNETVEKLPEVDKIMLSNEQPCRR